MRRLLPAVLFVTLAMGLFPSHADAYIWHWIDDLSGPRFDGLSFEVKFMCRLEEQRALEALLERAYRDYRAYQSSDVQLEAVKQALRKLDEAGKETDAATRSTLLEGAYQDLLTAENGPVAASTPRLNLAEKSLLRALAVGGSLSLCKARNFQRNQAFMSAGAGFGWDVKDDEARDNHLTQWWVGANYVLDRTVTVGAGAGQAVFTTRPSPSGIHATQVPFWYAQVDIRPWALRSNSIARGPWWQAVYFRTQYQQFVEPIRAGAFGPTSPRYPRETVANIGVWLDFEPLWRHYVRHTWQ